MVSNKPTAESIFLAAVALPADQRRPYLAQACGHDSLLFARVERLLAAEAREDSFLESPAPELGPALDPVVADQPGDVIGAYHLLEQIGEGGFGVVFRAEQTTPIRRRVALKIVKPGMDTRQVIARFEAERQALALMDHPAIAKVFDAGVTDQGRSYFVMELVPGIPITEYCDQCNLSTLERIELFIAVCQGVQHAHQKGIIHRDLKPTNVLVAMQDGRPVPKIIDFGIAKAIEQRLTQHTLTTTFAAMVGTPLYMSPEQAELSPLGVDTRTDVYSLGVLLYELLTGTTPFDKDRLHSATCDELRRIIRDEEPPSPSTRLSTLAAADATMVAERHRTDSRQLRQQLRGDLDWIVMKSLEKDRVRRYDSTSRLADDLLRFLRSEPVLARPPSLLYRFRRFARRNIAALATAILVSLMCLVAVASMGWALRDRAAQEEQLTLERAARQAKASGQLELILEDVARWERAEKWHEALVAARRAEPLLAAGEADPEIERRAQQALADLGFVTRLDEIRAEAGTVWGPGLKGEPSSIALAAEADREYLEAFQAAGISLDTVSVDEASRLIKARKAITAAVLPAIDDWIAVRSKLKNQAATQQLSKILRAADPDPWRQKVRDCLARNDLPALEKLVAAPDLARQPAATLCFLAAALQATDHQRLAMDVMRQAQWNTPNDFWINHRLGVNLVFTYSPRYVQEGIGFLRAAVAIRPNDSHSLMNLGNGFGALRYQNQADACYRKAIELNPVCSTCYANLGNSLNEQGRFEEAIQAMERALELKPGRAATRAGLSIIHSNRPERQLRKLDLALELAAQAVETEPTFANTWTALGMAHYRLRQWREARDALEKSLQSGNRATGGSFAWHEALRQFFLAMSHYQLGELESATASYKRAIAAIDANPSPSRLLWRIRKETESLLEIER